MIELLYLAFFILYTITILWFGKHGFDRVNSVRDFYLAGSTLGLVASVCTFAATWFSAASMLGLPGSLYAYGYAAIPYSIFGWFIGAAFIVLMSVRLRKYDVVTIPEFFRVRYQSKLMQAMGGLVIVFGYIFYIIIQIRGFGIVMSSLLDIPYSFSILFIYLFILYTTFGGLHSVTRTDVVNLLLIFGGSLLSAYFIVQSAGGITNLHLAAAEINTEVLAGSGEITPRGSLLHPFAMGLQPPLFLITAFCGWGLGLAANPQYAMRILSARDTRTAALMVGIAVLLLGFIYIAIILAGIGSRVMLPTAPVDSIDMVFPYIIDRVLHIKLGGLILISIIAAALSTANSQLLIIASGLTYDIYKNYSNSYISEEKFINLNRVAIAAGGTISLLLAVNPPQGLLVFGSNIWGIVAATFLFPLYGGLFWRGATRQGAIASFLGGLIVSVGWLRIYYNYLVGTPAEIIHPAFPGVLVSFLLFILISKLTAQTKKQETNT